MQVEDKNGLSDLPAGCWNAEAQALADKARKAKRKGDAATLARQALELDGGCTDAQVILARETCTSPRELASQLKLAVDRAEARLGAPFLRDHRQNLWAVPQARPYLRARLELAAALERSSRYTAAIAHLKAILETAPMDPLGARFALTRCYLASGDLKALAAHIRDWSEKPSAFFAWAAVLERVRARSESGARKALAMAREVNPHFEAFLTGQSRLPRHIPSQPQPGTPEEAAAALRLFGEAWTGDREGMYWLFKQA